MKIKYKCESCKTTSFREISDPNPLFYGNVKIGKNWIVLDGVCPMCRKKAPKMVADQAGLK